MGENFKMDTGAERLGLGDVEALVSDALVRAGASQYAADVVAQATRASERDGDRESGLGRVPRLLEGLAMSAINGRAEPVLSRSAQGIVHVDAFGGFSDLALRTGRDTVLELARSFGVGVLNVVNTGDHIHSAPWLMQMAAERKVVLAFGGPKANGTLFFNEDGTEICDLGAPPAECGQSIMGAITGRSPETWRQAGDQPPDQPVLDRMSVVLLRPEAANFAANGAALRDKAMAARRARREEVERDGVIVPSDLLVQILTA